LGIKYRVYRADSPLNSQEAINRKTYIGYATDYTDEFEDKDLPTGKYYYAVTTVDTLNNEDKELIIDQAYTTQPVIIIDKSGDRQKKLAENKKIQQSIGAKQQVESYIAQIIAKRKRLAAMKQKRIEERRQKEAQKRKKILAQKKEIGKEPKIDLELVLRKKIRFNIKNLFLNKNYHSFIRAAQELQPELKAYPGLQNENNYYLGRAYYETGNYQKALYILMEIEGKYKNVANLVYRNCLKQLQ
jgi:hypothetical protein